MFVVAAGLFAMFFFNTLYVQRVLGFSPLEAGLAFVPFTAGVIIGAGLSQKLVPGARRARGAADRLDARRGRAAPLPAADAGLVVRHRPSPRHPADLDRDGARVRADHADRDERRPASTTPALLRASSTRHSRSAARSGSRSCRRSRRTKTEDELASLGHRPTEAEQAEALVSGLPRHVARERDPARRRRAAPARPASAAATSSRSCRARPPRPPSRPRVARRRRRARGGGPRRARRSGRPPRRARTPRRAGGRGSTPRAARARARGGGRRSRRGRRRGRRARRR